MKNPNSNPSSNPNFIAPNILTNYQAPNYAEFQTNNQGALNKLSQKLSKLNPDTTSICLEGAHIYTNEQVNNNHLDQISYLKYLIQWLAEMGFNVETMLFVDDYHPDPANNIFNETEYTNIAKQLGVKFDSIVYETGLANEALALADIFITNGIIKNTKNRIAAAIPGNPVIVTEGQQPSCALLDAQLSLEKKKKYDLTINILPAEYKSEQRNTQRILKGLGQTPNDFLFTFLTN